MLVCNTTTSLHSTSFQSAGRTIGLELLQFDVVKYDCYKKMCSSCYCNCTGDL